MNPSKTLPRSHRLFSIALLSLMTMAAYSQGIPEPGLTLYGQVRNTSAGNAVVTFGTLRWTITPAGKAPVTVTTTLTNINDQFSYVLRVPFETVLADYTLSPGALALSSAPTHYARSATVAVTTGGAQQPATIVAPTLGNFAFGAADRGRLERVDLQVSLAVVDSDGDGLDDAWELANFGSLAPSGSADTDGDGMSNLAEYKAGTNPRDAQSRFAFIAVQRANPGVSIQWSSAPSTKYTIERSRDLITGFAPLVQNVEATPPKNIYLDSTISEQGAYFYRVRVQ